MNSGGYLKCREMDIKKVPHAKCFYQGTLVCYVMEQLFRSQEKVACRSLVCAGPGALCTEFCLVLRGRNFRKSLVAGDHEMRTLPRKGGLLV